MTPPAIQEKINPMIIKGEKENILFELENPQFSLKDTQNMFPFQQFNSSTVQQRICEIYSNMNACT